MFLRSCLITVCLLCARPALADPMEFSDQAKRATGVLGKINGAELRYEVLTEWEMGDYSKTRMRLIWKGGELILYEGMGVAPADEYRFTRNGDQVVVHYASGNRFAPSETTTSTYEWDAGSSSFKEISTKVVDAYEEAKKEVVALLHQGKLAKARERLIQISDSPNAGHSTLDDFWFLEFLRAVHKKALSEHKAGRHDVAATLVAGLLYAPPTQSPMNTPEEGQYLICINGKASCKYDTGYNDLPVTKETTLLLNDCAFFLEQGGYDEKAVTILKQIVDKNPKRTAAWLNLGDAYWDAGDQDNARVVYKRYAKDTKSVPERVSARLK